MGDEGTKGRGDEGRPKEVKTERLRDWGDWETGRSGMSFSGTEEFMGMKAYVYGEVNQSGQAGKLSLQASDPKRRITCQTGCVDSLWSQYPFGSGDEIRHLFYQHPTGQSQSGGRDSGMGF